MESWPAGEIRPLDVEQVGQRYRRYRLADPEAEREMVHSLTRYGQLSPIVVCLREEVPEVLDGFKRLTAAPSVSGMQAVSARLVAADERSAKAAIYGLNCTGRGIRELEEAWIIHALVREDGLSQLETAELLGRHKSWVCRRLALLEKLCEEARQDLRLGLLSMTQTRQLIRLPAGNQSRLLEAARREELSMTELSAIVDLLLAATGQQQEQFILSQPRQALQQSRNETVVAWDPRLSPQANRVAKRLGALLDQLARMETWLRHRGRADLSPIDRELLAPSFIRLQQDARMVAELAADFTAQLQVP
jgi:ParB-like chromosome segregation protein Spo0J